ncbi:sulfotransferase family protein [Prosthecodimorpha staleyi]|uniref:Sulfotransferase family protein n=1 Tax=Prosthecodimorpha staleyi TaxID=2840188 RepID=A0A947GFA1_9HYPH|nr:hypothetical protein [Prosthecodimorpha staleyi]MBT9292491.1 hypothetical protein [Prosthecodimorpha staleyi]
MANEDWHGKIGGPQRRALVVLGMHRSGTSALAGSLAALGAGTPARLMRPARFNPRGYWEPVAIVAVHDEILSAIEIEWSSWRSVPAAWFRSDMAARYRAILSDLVLSEYGASPLFVVKDPRMCRLLPLWHRVFAGLGIAPAFLIALRHPLAVAASLERREGIGTSRAVLVWMRHMLEAEASTRDRVRAFVSYEGVLADWRAELGEAGRRIKFDWPLDEDDRRAAVDAFLSADLRHHAPPPFDDALQGILPHAATVYRLLNALRAGDDSAANRATLDAIRRETDAWCRLFGNIGPEHEPADGRKKAPPALDAEAPKSPPPTIP